MPRLSRRWLRPAVAAIAVIAVTAGFSWRRGRSGSVGPAGQVVYETAWSWEGAQPDAHGAGYWLTTDRGYRVHLTAAYIGTASLELVPCRSDVPVPPFKAALDFFLPLQAQANHGYVHDSSLYEAPFIDSAFHGGASSFGIGQTSGKSYCQLHELIVPLDQVGSDGFHLDHWSAFVRGSYTLPGNTEEHPFEAHVNLRGGALVDLIAPPLPITGQMVVRVTRAPAHAFDGVQLEKLSPNEFAYAFMRGLTKGTRAEVLPR